MYSKYIYVFQTLLSALSLNILGICRCENYDEICTEGDNEICTEGVLRETLISRHLSISRRDAYVLREY